MNSATDVWEGGLGSSSDALGKNLMDHHLGIGAGGYVEGYEDNTLLVEELMVSIFLVLET
jgi:hypothetical protein